MSSTPESAAREGERGGDVVAVTDVDEPPAVEAAEQLAQGEEVGDRLGRVGAVGQQVDDRDVDHRRHLLEGGVVEHARRDDRAEPGEGAGDVGDRLAHAEADLLGPHVDRVTAEADHGHLGGRPRAGRRLLEQQHDALAGQRRRDGRRVCLPPLGGVEHRGELGGREVVDLEEVAAAVTRAPW